MPLIKCEDCSSDYSDKAESCPNCGCPTINNTIKEQRKNIKECSVKIRGNEKFPPDLLILDVILLFLFLFFTWFATTQIQHHHIFGNDFKIPAYQINTLVMYISGIAIFPSPFLTKLLPRYKKNYKHLHSINNYFKDRFILLDKLPASYAETNIINKTNNSTEAVLFDIYMEAYKLNTDYIVINNSNVSTQVSGTTSTGIFSKSVSGKTTSTNKFHITATLVKC